MLPKKGMSYGELIVDNILGLDNDYESFGEKLGKAVDEDELGFLKDAAVGVYEGAKEFITNPVETTKEVVTNIKDSVQRLGTEDLDTRLKNMYGVDYTQATDEQVNAAKEAVIGDALTAMELIPAAKVTVSAAKAGSAAIPSGVKADVVGQTKALLSGDTEFLKGTPTERSGTVGVGAEVVGQDDVSLDDITEYIDLEVEPTNLTASKKQTNPLVKEINYDNPDGTTADLYDFRSSVLGSLDNLAIGKDGMSGFQIKKFLEKRAPKINKTELYWSGLLENLDDNKKYSKQQLKTLADRNVPKVDIQVLDGSQVRYRGEQRVNLNVNNNVMQPLDGYKEIIIVNKNTKGTEYSAGHYDIMFQPDGNVLAHVRGSFVENNEPDFPVKEKFFLVEELQSDAVQQHTVADKAIAKKIKEQETSKPTLGDIGLHYQTEFNDMIFPYHAGGLEFTDKFVKDIDSYNYNFRSIGDQDTAEQAIQLGLTNIIDDMTKLKNRFLDGNTSKDAIVSQLSQKYGLKERSITRRSIEELDEVDNIFANVLGDYVFGKTAVRKFNKENDNEFKEDLINIFKGININTGLEKDLVPAKLSDTIRMSLLAVIKESKSEGVNKIYIPTPKVMSEAHSLSLEASYQTYYKGVTKVLRGLKKETNNKIKYNYKNPEDISYYNDPKSVGIEIDITNFDLPDNPQFRFAEGGVVKDMDNQMKMAFMQEGGLQDDGMDQDPVSGNEVPSGSMASEVRDDISANLSEGEYVVPADVVRFFGVKFFEDLRSEAKMGLQTMEADGRIGGEPVDEPMQDEGEMSDEEFNQLLQQELGNMQMAEGGMVPDMNEDYGVESSAPVAFNEGGEVTKAFNPFDYVTLGSTLTQGTASKPTEKPEDLSCPDGMVRENGICVPIKKEPRKGGDGSGTPPPPPDETGGFGFKDWGVEVDWSNTKSVKEFVDSQYNLPDPTVQKALGGASFLPGVGSLAAIAGAFGVGKAMETIADLRTSVMISKAYGNEEAAAYAQAKLEKALGESSKIASSAIGDKIASGAGQFSSHILAVTGIDSLPNNYDDWTKEDKEKFTAAINLTSKTPTVETTKTNNKSSDDNGPSAAEKAMAAAKTAEAAKASKTTENLEKVKEKSEKAYEAATSTEKELESQYGNLNKGGLMLKKEKNK